MQWKRGGDQNFGFGDQQIPELEFEEQPISEDLSETFTPELHEEEED